ncbi:DUF6069 family protein [Microbacterium hydrocarbonoxydans]|uniref:DUF6069 family protein n=1 Tax=Microbacterium hydrocarbonoxydans TaxID=273678 RepID=UPI002040908B|nr:DUF6069 family protein [Microbacterium hydrocarbonoxydans]MCM3778881.1 DUF6069 family protein [Microbacterium hydrocarbonoxydans]
MVTTASAQPAATRSRARAALILTTAVAIAIALNAVVAAVVIATGAPATYGPLTPPAFGLFTALGVTAGWVGWSLVRRHAKNPRRMLSILVPLVTVASFIPDVLLLALRFIPGTTTGAVIALMVMHVVVVAVAVPAYALASRTR